MRLDALLRAHAYMKVERPPELWEADTQDVRLLPLLGEMIAAALSTGTPLGELTLNAANVVVEAPDDAEDDPMVPTPGEYVALTVSGDTDFGPDAVWPAAPGRLAGLLQRLADRLVVAGARYAYIRKLPTHGSLTVFLSRAGPPPLP